MRCRVLACAVLLVVALVTVTAAGCGPKEQKTEVDIRARILTIEETDPPVIRVSELEAGRHWEFVIPETCLLREGKETLTISDLALGNHLRIRANTSADDSKVYEAVYVDLLDSGEAAER